VSRREQDRSARIIAPGPPPCRLPDDLLVGDLPEERTESFSGSDQFLVEKIGGDAVE
jgi:hypothetical protein